MKHNKGLAQQAALILIQSLKNRSKVALSLTGQA